MICSGCNREFWRDDALLEDNNYSIQRNKLPQTIGFRDLYSTFDSDYSCKLATYFSNLLEDGFADTNKKKVYLRIELWHLQNNGRRNSNRFVDKLIMGF